MFLLVVSGVATDSVLWLLLAKGQCGVIRTLALAFISGLWLERMQGGLCGFTERKWDFRVFLIHFHCPLIGWHHLVLRLGDVAIVDTFLSVLKLIAVEQVATSSLMLNYEMTHSACDTFPCVGKV